MMPITDPIFWEDSDCPRLGPPEVEVKRGRPPSKRRSDGTEKRKRFSRIEVQPLDAVFANSMTTTLGVIRRVVSCTS